MDVLAADGGGVGGNRHRGRADVMADEQSFGGLGTADPRQGERVIVAVHPGDLEELLLAYALNRVCEHCTKGSFMDRLSSRRRMPLWYRGNGVSDLRQWTRVYPSHPAWPGSLGTTVASSLAASAPRIIFDKVEPTFDISTFTRCPAYSE